MSDKFLQFLGLTKRAGKLTEGYNKCEEIIKRSRVFLLILSNDVSNNTKELFVKYCQDKQVRLIQSYNSEELGAAVGRPEVKVLCITDKQMSEKLIALHEMLEFNRG